MEGAHGPVCPNLRSKDNSILCLSSGLLHRQWQRANTAWWFPGVAEGRAAAVLAMLLFFTLHHWFFLLVLETISFSRLAPLAITSTSYYLFPLPLIIYTHKRGLSTNPRACSHLTSPYPHSLVALTPSISPHYHRHSDAFPGPSQSCPLLSWCLSPGSIYPSDA